MHRRALSLRLTLAAAALGIAGAAPVAAFATTTYGLTVECVETVSGSAVPLSASASSPCGNAAGMVTESAAAASQGHLGAALGGSLGFGAEFGNQAVIDTPVIFTATNGSSASSITVALNLGINGTLSASNAGTTWRLFGGLGGVGFDIGTSVGGAQPVQHQTNIGFTSGGETFGPGSDAVSGTLTTAFITVPVNVAITLEMILDVGGSGNNGSFDAQFLNSIDFLLGSDVFTLPDGFTANDADMFLVNNRFAPTAVPEPSSLALLGAGLIGLAGARRRRRAA